MTRAINSPAGEMAQSLLSRLAVHTEKVPDWIWQALKVITDARTGSAHLAQVLLASRTQLLFNLDRYWTTENLIPLFSWKCHKYAAAAWVGYIWQFGVTADLWPFIKADFILALKNYDGLGPAAKSAASWFTAICINQPLWIEYETASAILKQFPGEARAAAAHVLLQRLEGALDESDSLWRERIGPWLNGAWPKSPKLRDSSASLYLALAALTKKDEFPAAVPVVLEIIGSGEMHLYVQHYEALFARHTAKHPTELMRLLAAMIGTGTRLYDKKLRVVLNGLGKACPACTESPEYRLIEEALRANSL